MKENRIDFAFSEHRRRAFLPAPSRRRALRRRVGLSQSVIADAIGVSPPTLSRYEAGISAPRGDVLVSYLQILTLLAAKGTTPRTCSTPRGRRRRARWRTGPAMNENSWAAEARLYLAALFDGERAGSLIEVRCPRYPRLRSFFLTWGMDSASRYVASCAEIADIYVGVAPRFRTDGRQTGGKAAIDHVQALWADCDTPDSIAMLADFVPVPRSRSPGAACTRTGCWRHQSRLRRRSWATVNSRGRRASIRDRRVGLRCGRRGDRRSLASSPPRDRAAPRSSARQRRRAPPRSPTARATP